MMDLQLLVDLARVLLPETPVALVNTTVPVEEAVAHNLLRTLVELAERVVREAGHLQLFLILVVVAQQVR
jgi:hypothetical protein